MLAPEGAGPSFELVFDHSEFIVVDKAPGTNLHRNHKQRSLLDDIREEANIDTPFLVHRLDDATSGLLMLAKNASAAAQLSSLFAERRIEKYYLAIADGKPAKKQGSVIGDLEKSRNGSYRLSRSMTNPSRTQFFSFALSPGRRLYLLRPFTGKTHQLRVVMKSLGVPILGDTRYGGAKASGDRLYLHAYCLRFSFASEQFSLRCPPCVGGVFQDGAMGRALLDLQSPWDLDWPLPKRSASFNAGETQ